MTQRKKIHDLAFIFKKILHSEYMPTSASVNLVIQYEANFEWTHFTSIKTNQVKSQAQGNWLYNFGNAARAKFFALRLFSLEVKIS